MTADSATVGCSIRALSTSKGPILYLHQKIKQSVQQPIILASFTRRVGFPYKTCGLIKPVKLICTRMSPVHMMIGKSIGLTVGNNPSKKNTNLDLNSNLTSYYIAIKMYYPADIITSSDLPTNQK